MSLPFRPRPHRRAEAALALALALALAGCTREDRDSRGTPVAETGPPAPETTTLYAGGPTPSKPDPRSAMYEGNSFHVSQGQRLFSWMNCVGCHAHGGGSIGPPLMDDQWRYGGSMEQIVSTIMQGRPNGMPSFRNKLTEQQVWELAAYVRSMSGQPSKDVVSARADEMSNTPPQTQTPKTPVKLSSPAAVQGTTQ
jgi:cytochrome c oxidase cbb3-type subunit 3